MTDPASEREAPIGEYDELLRLFQKAEKPPQEWRIGAEMEKPGVDAETGAVLAYEGERSVTAVLDEFVRSHGWKAHSEYEGGPRIALLRDRASITLEPGGQLELSGAPLVNVHEICSEFRGHMHELRDVSQRLAVRWLGVGFHPFARREDLPWIPKDRYKIMREYLPTRGDHALDMMLRTSTVQANYDFESEDDAMLKMRVALKLAPLTTAMFANSPWLEGELHGGVSYRARVWLDVDPDRSGLVPALWREGRALPRLRRVGARRPDVPLQARQARVRQHGADLPLLLEGRVRRRAGRRTPTGRCTSTRSSPRFA